VLPPPSLTAYTRRFRNVAITAEPGTSIRPTCTSLTKSSRRRPGQDTKIRTRMIARAFTRSVVMRGGARGMADMARRTVRTMDLALMRRQVAAPQKGPPPKALPPPSRTAYTRRFRNAAITAKPGTSIRPASYTSLTKKITPIRLKKAHLDRPIVGAPQAPVALAVALMRRP
jgi:hypothetical protein